MSGSFWKPAYTCLVRAATQYFAIGPHSFIMTICVFWVSFGVLLVLMHFCGHVLCCFVLRCAVVMVDVCCLS